jgi:single-stranded DNA-binding protein
MMGALLTGELSAEPVERTASNGKPFWTATLRVPTGTDALFVGVSTFSETAGVRLMKLHKGSALAAVGTMEPTEWTGKDGEPRRGWRLTATELLTVYEATKRRKPSAGGEGDE